MPEDTNVLAGPWSARDELRRLASMTPLEYEQARPAAAKALKMRAAIMDKEIAAIRRARGTVDGQPEWILTANGDIRPIFANAITALRHYGFNLSFSQFSIKPFYNGAALEDGALLEIAEAVQRTGVYADKKTIDQAVFRVAAEKPFHEVKDWLDGLKWDGRERIDQMLIDVADAADTPLNRTWTRQWLIQAVARIYEPGCKADSMLILESPQGFGKSTFFQVLFGAAWFTDHLPDISQKDAMIQLRGKWCIEIGELSTLGRAEVEAQKRFLTSSTDTFRLPWDRMASDHPRQCVFAGTTNKSDYLKDETGARRFCPITVDEINTGIVENMREQYWAEAVHRYKDGEKWYLPRGDLADAAEAAQRDRYKSDVWTDDVAAWIANKPYVLLQDILRESIGLSSKADWGQREENRIAAILRHLGWNRRQRRVDERRIWVYEPPNNPSKHYGDITGKSDLNVACEVATITEQLQLIPDDQL